MCFGCNGPRKHTTNHPQLPWRSLCRAWAFFRLVSKKVTPRSIARAFLSKGGWSQKRQTASAVLSLLLLACLDHPSRETRGELCLRNGSCVAWTLNMTPTGTTSYHSPLIRKTHVHIELQFFSMMMQYHVAKTVIGSRIIIADD